MGTDLRTILGSRGPLGNKGIALPKDSAALSIIP